MVGLFVGNGTVDHPDGGLLIGNGYNASPPPAQVCAGAATAGS
jgi:hypothetical protein